MPHQRINTDDYKQNISDNEFINLAILWQVVKAARFWIISIIALSMLIALIYAFALPKRWEATATLQVGRISTSITSIGDSKLIEDPTQAVERIKLREFKEKVLTAMHLHTEESSDDRTDLLLATLKGNAIKGTDFITITARGYSIKDAADALVATCNEMKLEHQQITKPILIRLTQERLEIINKLVSVKSELKDIQAQMSAEGIYKPNTAFSPAIVAINISSAKESEIRYLNTQIIQYNALLASFDELSTRFVNKIYVSNHPVFPRKSIFLMLGLCFGLLLSSGLVLFRYTRFSTQDPVKPQLSKDL